MLRLFLRPQQALIAGGLLVLTSILLVHTIFQPNYAELVPGFGSTQNNEPILEDVDLGIAAGPLLPEEYREQYPSLTLPQSLLGFPKLHEKLHAFLSRPVYSYEEGKSWNENHCPREISDKLVNPDQLNGDGDFWRHDVTPQVIRQKRADLVNHLADLLKQGETVVWPQSMELEDYETEVEELQPFKRAPITQQPSRGIVTTGGNADTTARLITLLRFLRNEYHVTLPVEVWAFPGELKQGSDQWRDIEALNGQIREVPESYHLVKDTGAWKNFQIKGLAIALSSFQELIYLDSDNIPLRDPTCLFETESYTKEDSGKAVFWPDLSKDHVDNAIWRVMGTPCTLDDFTFESGQIVIDKAGNDGLNMAALQIAAYMQAEKDFWFRMCGGDKDTFRWAFVALDVPFTRATRWATCLGQMHRGRFCGHSILQYELDPAQGETRQRPLFVHSNLLKHISGVRRGETFTHVKRMSLDNYSEPSLNQAHMWVYWGDNRGMCTDVELRDDGEGLTESEREAQFVLTQSIDEMEERPLEGFEDLFFRQGGRAGGWRKRDKPRRSTS